MRRQLTLFRTILGVFGTMAPMNWMQGWRSAPPRTVGMPRATRMPGPMRTPRPTRRTHDRSAFPAPAGEELVPRQLRPRHAGVQSDQLGERVPVADPEAPLD